MASRPADSPGGWYYGWNIVSACILSQVAANGLTYNTYSLWLGDWSRDLHAQISDLQLPIAFLGVVAAATSPFIGALADKAPPRRLFMFGLLGMAAFYLAVSVANSGWQLWALYALLAPVMLGLCTTLTANALISRWFVRRRGLALGLSAFGIGMAGVVLPPVIAWLLPVLGWRGIWRAGAALVAVVIMPIVVTTIRERPTEREGLHYVSPVGALAPHHEPDRSGELRWADVLSRRNFWLLLAAYLPIMAVQGATSQNIAPFAARHGFSTEAAGLLLSTMSLTHVLSTITLGTLADRFGTRLPFAGLAVIVAAGAILLSLGGPLAVAFAGCALIGCGGGFMTLLATGIASEFGPQGFGRGFGVSMAFLPVSAFVPFAVARSQELTASYVPALIALAIAALIGGALVLMLKERRGACSPLPTEPVPEDAAATLI